MTYNKTTWADRQVQYPMQFSASGAVTGTVTLTPNEGTITQAGTPITSANMNNLENGVSNVDSRLTTVEGKYFDKSAGGQITGNVGLGIAPTYGLHQLGGSQKLQALATPAAPTVTQTGSTGTTSYSYYVVAKDINGFQTLPSSVKTITTGNATLSGTNYNTISWTAVPGAVSYDVLKGDTGHSLALGITGTSINDTGQTTASYTAPTRNTTADYNTDGNITVGGDIHAENGHLYVGGAGHDIIFNAGRANTSNLYWNANPTVDYGLNFNVDGVHAFTMWSNSVLQSGQGDMVISGLNSSNVYLRNGGAGTYIHNINGTAFAPINASAFNVNSDETMKKNITPFAENAESLVNGSTVYQYNYNNELDTEPKHTGLIMQQSPVELCSINGVGIDIYAMCGVMWKAIQELSAKVQTLENVQNSTTSTPGTA